MGSLYTALASFLDARHHRGSWQLRIDDIDPPRAVAGSVERILAALRAHGLLWDGQVIYQSQSADAFERALDNFGSRERSFAAGVPAPISKKQAPAAKRVSVNSIPTMPPTASEYRLIDRYSPTLKTPSSGLKSSLSRHSPKISSSSVVMACSLTNWPPRSMMRCRTSTTLCAGRTYLTPLIASAGCKPLWGSAPLTTPTSRSCMALTVTNSVSKTARRRLIWTKRRIICVSAWSSFIKRHRRHRHATFKRFSNMLSPNGARQCPLHNARKCYFFTRKVILDR